MKKIQTNKGAVPVKPIIIIIIIVVIALGVMAMNRGDSVNTNIHPTQTQNIDINRGDDSEEMDNGDHDGEMMDDSIDSTQDKEDMKDAPVADQAGSYEDYSPEKIARAENGKVVLFFHAGWCPTCRNQENNILKSAADIPAGLSILKLDYDKETELKKKYGIRLQHTFVQVDANGEMINGWAGGTNLDDIVKNLI